jgi:hypothetical protein
MRIRALTDSLPKPLIVDDIFSAFVNAVRARLESGARQYGERSFSRPPTELAGEIEEELLDLPAGVFSYGRGCEIRDALEVER